MKAPCFVSGIAPLSAEFKPLQIEITVMNSCNIFAVTLVASALSASAGENVHYCVEEKIAGMGMIDGEFVPYWSDDEGGRRYTINFNDDYSQLKGVQGGTTIYNCVRGYPNRAPDLITCTNSKMITTTYTYSTESGHFTMALNHPGGWLSIGTDRESQQPKTDLYIFGRCQNF